MRIAVHAAGVVKTACRSTAADAIDASAVNTRMCPTRFTSLGVKLDPSKKPT
jgi:hypothetical protein